MKSIGHRALARRQRAGLAQRAETPLGDVRETVGDVEGRIRGRVEIEIEELHPINGRTLKRRCGD